MGFPFVVTVTILASKNNKDLLALEGVRHRAYIAGGRQLTRHQVVKVHRFVFVYVYYVWASGSSSSPCLPR